MKSLLSLNDFIIIQKKNIILNGNFNFSSITDVSEIACGGFGCAYKVTTPEGVVCIKIEKSNSNIKEFSEIFVDKNINVLLRSYIPIIYEIGTFNIGRVLYYYIVMEYFKEKTLSDIKINDHDVIKLMIFLVKFMYILHINNLSYTDIKPSNIILTNNGFKIIDVDTIDPLIQTSNKSKFMTNTITKYYSIANTDYFTIHQLNQLVTCIFTCLKIMDVYPKCKGSSILKSTLQYGSYLLEMAEKNNITNALILENSNIFQKYLNILEIQTHNLAYSLLSLIYLYILLIPKYTIAYINERFICNTLEWYNKYIPSRSMPCTTLCSNASVVNKYKDIIRANNVQPWTKDTNPDEEIRKIPKIINYDIYIQILPTYIQEYKNRRMSQIIKQQYEALIQQDNYTNLRADPRTTLGTPFYKRI